MCIDLSATVVVNEPDDYELDIVSGGIQLTIGSMSEEEFYGSSSWRFVLHQFLYSSYVYLILHKHCKKIVLRQRKALKRKDRLRHRHRHRK